MPPDQSQSDRSAVSVVGLLRRGCWAAVPVGTIESLIAGGRVVDFRTGSTVYTEADAERLAVMMDGLLRVYMHASDGRQVTVRYVRAGDLLGVPALIGGPAPVFVQAVTPGEAFFFDIAQVKRAALIDASLAWALAEESRSSAVRCPRRARRKRVRVRPPARRAAPPGPRHFTSGSRRTLIALGQSAGSREQRRFGARSGRARPRRASRGTARPNVARSRGDSRSDTDEPRVVVTERVTKVTAPENRVGTIRSRGHD